MSKRPNKPDSRKAVRQGMMRLGITPARKPDCRTGRSRKVRKIKAFLNRFVRTRFAFLMVAHQQELPLELDMIELMVKREGLTEANKVAAFANKHLRQFAKDNGWFRNTKGGKDIWTNPAYNEEWLANAVHALKLEQDEGAEEEGDE